MGQSMSSLRIEAIECIPVTVPIEAPILTCYGSLGAYPRVLIKLVAENGMVGYGETAARYKPETFRMFESVFRGANPWDSTRLISRIKHWNYYPWQKPEPLMAGLEIACLDLCGKSIGEPVHRILGGKIHARVPVASYVFFRHANAEGKGRIHSVEEAVDFARSQVAAYGFGAIKLKGGYFAPEVDRDTLFALRETFGRDMKLRLDPQGCWTPVTAVRIGRQLDAIDLEYYEDPCWNAAAMAKVRKSVTTPLATNMCVTQFEEFHPATMLGAVDVVLSDIWYWGGVRATMAVDRMCHATGIDLGMHSSAELGVGWAAMIHVASAMPHMKLAIDCMNLHLADDIIQGGKLVPKDGTIAPPDGPGLGIEIDEAKLARYGALATSGAAADRFLNPGLADSARPGWYPHSPAW
jgi:glucarate dehydratase